MTDGTLQLLFTDLLNTIAPKKRLQVTAVFYDTKSLRHTIQLKRKHIEIRIAQKFKDAPEHILHSLGIILYSKIFRYKVDSKTRRIYKEYVEESILHEYPVEIRKPSSRYKAQGKVYNLEYIFDDINRAYFQNRLKKPTLGWSLNKSYTRLGFYVEDKKLLVISRIFDSSRVPVKIVEYMVYHEMLHIVIPARTVNGRRKVHYPEFKKMDRSFPEYDEIQKWIKKYRKKL
jgi:hypothetical protein